MRVVIVDDEKHNRDGLKLLLQNWCPDVEVVGEAANAKLARSLIQTTAFDVMLLDIHMPNENGLELIESIEERNFATVFVTAYAEHAIRALKANAIDYLLKPIDAEELVAAMKKCKNALKSSTQDSNDEIFLASAKNASHMYNSQSYPKKLTIFFYNGFQIVDVTDITHMDAEGSYTVIYFQNQTSLLTSKAIKEFEEVLDPEVFFRAHKSYLVNMQYIKSYSSVDGHEIILNNNSKIPLARRRLEEFMSALANVSLKL